MANDAKDRFIAEIENNTLIGYKYFGCKDVKKISVTLRGSGKGVFRVCIEDNKEIARIFMNPSEDWVEVSTDVVVENGVHPLYFIYEEEAAGEVEMLSFSLAK